MMTFREFINAYPETERGRMERSTLRLDVAESGQQMMEDMRGYLGRTLFHVALCDKDEVVDAMQVVAHGKHGDFSVDGNLDIFPLEDSKFPVLQGTDVETFVNQVGDTYGVSKCSSRAAQAEALCSDVESGVAFSEDGFVM